MSGTAHFYCAFGDGCKGSALFEHRDWRFFTGNFGVFTGNLSYRSEFAREDQAKRAHQSRVSA